MSNKEYLHKLLIIRDNLQEFSYSLCTNDKLYFSTMNYLSRIDIKIRIIAKRVLKEDRDFYHILLETFDF